MSQVMPLGPGNDDHKKPCIDWERSEVRLFDREQTGLSVIGSKGGGLLFHPAVPGRKTSVSNSAPDRQHKPSTLTLGRFDARPIFKHRQYSSSGFSAKTFGAQRWQIPFSGGLVVTEYPQFHKVLARGPQAHR